MRSCTECFGNGFLQNGNNMNLDNGGGGSGATITFTTLKTVPETPCSTCLGTGIQNGAGT
jgi:hypothetical protein